MRSLTCGQARERLVVIGGDAAGMSAASQDERRRPDLAVVAFERGWATSCSTCGIDVPVCAGVTGIDIDRCQVWWRDLEGAAAPRH